MDEKWVDGVVTRSNIKVLKSYDLDARHHYAHHKSHIDQVMFIVVNGFIPKDNDLLGNGGRSVKVSCIPIEDMEEEKRDSYTRVYDDSEDYTYPHITENLERRKGEMYWTNKTLCGTLHVKPTQFSLIHAYNDTIIPRMEEIARIESENGKYDVVFFEQEDSAGCHNSKEYNKFKDKEFSKRKWLRRCQSPQSPVFNINDHFYFRKLSKEISAQQSLSFGTKVMKFQEIIDTTKKIWEKKDDNVEISRGWMAHHQVIAAALEAKREN